MEKEGEQDANDEFPSMRGPDEDGVAEPEEKGVPFGLSQPSPSEDNPEIMDKSSSGVSSTISPHYDPKADVILRAEWIGERSMKNLILGVELVTLAGIALLCVAVYWQVDKGPAFYLRDRTIPVVNLTISTLCLAALLLTSVGFVRRTIRSNASGKRWSFRRKRGATNSVIEQSLQLVNLTCFVASNAFLLAGTCRATDRVIVWLGAAQWTCWNALFLMQWIGSSGMLPIKGTRWEYWSKARDAVGMDVPLLAHWRKLVVFVPLQSIIILLSVMFSLSANRPSSVTAPGFCPGEESNCHLRGYMVALTVLSGCVILVYQALFIWNMRLGFLFLASQPYNEYRMGNQIIRIQASAARLRGLAMIVFICCMIIDTFVHQNTCSSFVLSWVGYLPMQLVMTGIVLANAILLTPKRPADGAILGVWLQEFAWTERDIQNKKEERSSSLPEGTDADRLDAEPMWCFETAVKLIYWCFLCYDYNENNSKAAYSVDTALSLYDLHSFEMMWEESMDTKCLIGWNGDTVVISFRGTASMANVASDLKVWRECWPKNITRRRCFSLMGTPKVHSGFYHAYTANGFNLQLMERLKAVLLELKANNPDRRVRVYVTGHSLGGALATLCAYDIMTHCQRSHIEHYEVSCYTFGAPRTGNHAFARLFMQTVPDTWHVINSDDTVTRSGKFFFLYKRGGHRTLINMRGDLLVRPPYVEQFVHRMPGAGSLKDHYLTSYQRSMTAVLAAQFGRKSLMGGKDGVRNLTRNAGTRAVLEKAGLTWEDFERLEREGLSAGLRSTSGLVNCSCGEMIVPTWPQQWIDGFKPCRRAKERRATEAAAAAAEGNDVVDLESGGSVTMGPGGEVCMWPRAIKVEKRHGMRRCAGAEASTMCNVMKSFRMKKKVPTGGTWCDSELQGSNKESLAQAESMPDLAAVDESVHGPTHASMDREDESFEPSMSLSDLEQVDFSHMSAAGDDRARFGSFVIKR